MMLVAKRAYSDKGVRSRHLGPDNVDFSLIFVVEDESSHTGFSFKTMNKNDKIAGTDVGIPASIFEVAMWRRYLVARRALRAIAAGNLSPEEAARVARKALIKMRSENDGQDWE